MRNNQKLLSFVPSFLSTLLLIFVSFSAQAKFVTALNFEPYAFYSTGTYKILDTSEKGKLDNMGAGLRAGLAFQYFSISGDIRSSNSSMKPKLDSQNHIQNDTLNNPTKMQSLLEYGATAAIELGVFQIYYSYFPQSELKGKGSTELKTPFDYSYTGSSQEYGIKLVLYRGFSISAGQHLGTYKRFSRDSFLADNGVEVSKSTNQVRTALQTQQWTGALSYQFLF